MEKQEGFKGNQHTSASAQNEHNQKTAQKLSSQYKVSPATIRRDAEYAEDVNLIADATGAHGIEVVAQTKGKLGRRR